MITRAKARSFKPKTNNVTQYPLPKALITSKIPIEPSSYSAACKIPEWRAAMAAEVDALLRRQTWSLVPVPPGLNVVGYRWVYKIKQRSDGSIERFKARLVAKGYNQQEGLNYDETFSSIWKPTTIRVVLSLAMRLNWPIRQMDVHDALLHDILNEEVYMTQPQGFIDQERPHHVFRLHKSIYGLK